MTWLQQVTKALQDLADAMSRATLQCRCNKFVACPDGCPTFQPVFGMCHACMCLGEGHPPCTTRFGAIACPRTCKNYGKTFDGCHVCDCIRGRR